MPFHYRNIHQVAIEMFKVKHDLSPPFMKEIFCHKGNERGTRSGDVFVRPHVESVKKGDRSLRSFGPIIWNTMLPERLKECTSLDKFKDSIRSWVPDNCPCELCKTYVPGLGYVSIFGMNLMSKTRIVSNVQNCIHWPKLFWLLRHPFLYSHNSSFHVLLIVFYAYCV